MFVSDWPNNAFAFENVEFYLSYNGDILELAHTPFGLSFIVCSCCSHLQQQCIGKLLVLRNLFWLTLLCQYSDLVLL